MDKEISRPLLDIIMPVYNTAAYLDECIESVVNQTLSDWHLIIVDDGSTDSSPQICDSWEARDSRIEVVHKPNTGQADSRNLAIAMCTARYVGFVDSDDKLSPDMYSFLVGNMEKYNAEVAVCDHYIYKTNKIVKRGDSDKVELLDWEMANRYIIRDKIRSYLWQMVFRRECLSTTMPHHVCYEDYAVLPQWFKDVKCVVFTQKPFYYYRMRRSSVVNAEKPENYYAFLAAEQDRVYYYRNTIFSDEMNFRLLLRAIRVAKYIARLKIGKAAILDYLDKIKPVVLGLRGEYASRLKRKDRLLLSLLTRASSLFYAYQKTEVLLMKHKHRKSKHGFE